MECPKTIACLHTGNVVSCFHGCRVSCKQSIPLLSFLILGMSVETGIQSAKFSHRKFTAQMGRYIYLRELSCRAFFFPKMYSSLFSNVLFETGNSGKPMWLNFSNLQNTAFLVCMQGNWNRSQRCKNWNKSATKWSKFKASCFSLCLPCSSHCIHSSSSFLPITFLNLTLSLPHPLLCLLHDAYITFLGLFPGINLPLPYHSFIPLLSFLPFPFSLTPILWLWPNLRFHLVWHKNNKE